MASTAPQKSAHEPLRGRMTLARLPRATGLARAANHTPHVEIKIGGRVVGNLYPPDWLTERHEWVATLILRGSAPGNPECPWHRVRLKMRWPDEATARRWFEENDYRLRGTFDLYQLEM